MPKAAIYIYGIPGIDKPEAQKTIVYTNEKLLISHLRKLQSGYLCEDETPKDKVKVNKITHPQTKKKIIECYSNSDFRYVALLGMQIKQDANKPIEYI